MKNINEVDIRINRAEVNEVSVKLINGQWHMEINGSLISETGQSVSNFSFDTNGWNQRQKFDFPLSALGISAELFKIAEPIVIKKIQGHFSSLGSGEEND